MGAVFDEAGSGSAIVRAEPAIVDGMRLVVEAGVIIASAPHADRLTGFRSIPARLGGGFLLWSSDRVYHAATFLGDLRPIADAAVESARPWLDTILIRTRAGLMEIDPASLAARPVAWPGVVDAVAIDARRGARLDLFGRATVTTDGGRTFTDLLASRGIVVRSLREEGAEIVLAGSRRASLRLGLTGDLGPGEAREVPAAEVRTAGLLPEGAAPASSRALSAEIASAAAALGAPIAGRRVLVTREGGARLLAAGTGLPVGDADLSAIDEKFGRCQAAAAGASPALLCAGAAGAEVITAGAALTRLALDATFPAEEAIFFAGPGGRLARDGRCGPQPPRATDLGPGTPRPGGDPGTENPPDLAPAAPDPDDPPIEGEASACLRAGPARWIARRLRGDDARRLYRWVPGDDGAITALVFAEKGARAPADPPPEGVRVIRLDPEDPALHGAAFPPVAAPFSDPPARLADADYWIDAGGEVRGWVKLPPLGEDEAPRAAAASVAGRKLPPLAEGRGGRAAGVRIDAAGHVTVLPLPEGVTDVVMGGRFALASAPGTPEGAAAAWFESTDGGARWAPIEPPPAGRLEAPGDDHAPFGCTAIGCAAGDGLVRLGWGGPPPRPAPDLAPPAAAADRPRELALPAIRCRLEAPWPRASSAAEPIGAHYGSTPTAAPAGGRFDRDVIAPFAPLAAPRRAAFLVPGSGKVSGDVIPVLTDKPRAPVDLLITFADHRVRPFASPALLPGPPHARVGSAIDLAGGATALFDPHQGDLFLARGSAVSPILRLARPDAASRRQVTLAHTPAGPAVVGYAVTSGEVVAAAVDLSRAEVGPPRSLPRLSTLAACPEAPAAARFVVEIALPLRLVAPGAEAPIADAPATLAALIAAGADRLCLLGVEASVPGRRGAVLSATFGPGATASVRAGAGSTRASCGVYDR